MTWCVLRKFKAVWNELKKCFIGFDENGNEIELLVVFTNTSREKQETLDFVRACDENFGFHTVWIEAVFSNKKGVGTKFKIVDFETAKQHGEVFEQMIQRYGIPNKSYKHCTRELKTVPITKFCRSRGWKNKTYESWIGYRIDEPLRWKTDKQKLSAKKKKYVFYFIGEKPTTKTQVNGWWSFQRFNLQLEEHEGNCDKCHKKNENKLIAICGNELNHKTEDYWWDDMELKYENFTPPSRKTKNAPYRFYRGKTSIKQIRDKAKIFYEKAFGDDNAMEVYTQALLNNNNPKQIRLCNEACEPF